MQKKLRHFFIQYRAIMLVCLLTILVMLPLMKTGFWPMHDDEQVGRLYALDTALRAGHIPPRIAPGLGFGYGYPLFNFYPSLVYYVAELFVVLGFSYIVSLKLMLVLGFLLAAIFMYRFSREYLGEAGGVLSAVAYTYAPYHALDIYVRGAFPEFWSFVFIPALFWACLKISQTYSSRYVLYLALGVAGLIMSHNLVAFMSSIFIGSYVLYLVFSSHDKKKVMLMILGGGLLGLGLSAFFWIPSFFERNYTMISLLTKELADYHQHFVYLRQLWNSPWGYGGSLYGLEDGLSFQIGKLHILFAILSLGVAVFVMRQKRKIAPILALFLAFFFVSIFFLSFYSEAIWDNIQPLSYIQFPWRFLLFAAFSSSFLLGSVVLLPFTKRMRLAITTLILVGLVLLNYDYFQPAKYFLTATDDSYTKPEIIQWRTSIMAFEYVPKGVATKTSTVGTTIIDITPQEVASSTAQVISGEMNIVTIVDKPQEKQLTVTVKEPGELQLSTFAFPGWEVMVNNKKVSYSDQNKLKLMTIDLPVGTQHVRAVFTDTPLRIFSNSLTVIGLILTAGLLMYARMSQKRKHKSTA